ncbi:hypothetical protein HUU05_02510 [candidate division KSB1 bacterium]|nr:hypothetical protein [candidate division KSB1 bacterium]
MQTANFIAQRIAQSRRIKLNGPLHTVFPLFGPITEKLWVQGWDPEIVYLNAKEIAEHMIFRTPPRFENEPPYTWILSKYAPESALVEYTIFTPDRLWTITVQCEEGSAAQTTHAEITYAFTGLSELGNAMNEKALHAMYANDLKDWEEAINHYLKTGEKVKQP